MQRTPDPYRQLGVPRGASEEQIKAAHRALAKRYHPDSPTGDRAQFLAVQDAYSLLSDPLRRRDWDARHAPGPVRAGEGGTRGARARAASGRWTREDASEGGRKTRPSGGRATSDRSARGRSAAGGGSAAGGAHEAATAEDGASEDRRRPADAWSPSGRESSSRTYTWSAEGVPWWEDFTPRSGGGSTTKGTPKRARRPAATPQPHTNAGEGTGGTGAGKAVPPPPPSADLPRQDFDVYSRSSGAAWSSAARRYFRRGDKDLPKGGSFVYRGTQVVTGAEARRVAEEAARTGSEQDFARPRPGSDAAPRQAFDHAPSRSRATAPPPRPAAPPPAAPAGAPPSRQGAGTAWPYPSEREAPPAPEHHASDAVGAAAVGAVAAVIFTLPAVALGAFLATPTFQPWAVIVLMVIAALVGAGAAMLWERYQRSGRS